MLTKHLMNMGRFQEEGMGNLIKQKVLILAGRNQESVRSRCGSIPGEWRTLRIKGWMALESGLEARGE